MVYSSGGRLPRPNRQPLPLSVTKQYDCVERRLFLSKFEVSATHPGRLVAIGSIQSRQRPKYSERSIRPRRLGPAVDDTPWSARFCVLHRRPIHPLFRRQKLQCRFFGFPRHACFGQFERHIPRRRRVHRGRWTCKTAGGIHKMIEQKENTNGDHSSPWMPRNRPSHGTRSMQPPQVET